jgi:hypothetical protein
VHETPLHIIAAALDLIAYLSLSTPHPASQPVSRLLSFLWIFPFFFTTDVVPRMFEEQPNGPNPCFPVVLRSGEFLWETRKSIWTRSSIAWSQVRGTGTWSSLPRLPCCRTP